jgi:hypothetical protein
VKNFINKKQIEEAWKAEWNNAMAIRIILILVIAALFLVFVPSFLVYIQQRQGIQLNDRILALIPSADLSWVIFPVIHASILVAIASLIHYPRLLLIAIESYLLASFLRMLAIYLFPMEPPYGLVMLTDHVNEGLFYSNTVITKDLFFSGHTTTIFILYLAVRQPMLKLLFLCLTVAIAIMLLIQHIHYSVDIAGALVFTWASYYSVLTIEKKILEGFSDNDISHSRIS